MAGENTLNNRQQGGDLWEVGGELRVVTGGSITPNSGTQPAAIADHAAAAGANPTKAEYDALVVKFNLTLAALRGVGLIAT
jgi:hypothetical protein